MRNIVHTAIACLLVFLITGSLAASHAFAQPSDPHSGTAPRNAHPPAADSFYLLRPDKVFDGEQMHDGWQVLVHGRLIEAAGAPGSIKPPPGTIIIDLKGAPPLPGVIDGP